MLAITGAVLIHAACVLEASVLMKGDDTFTIYALTRILMGVGSFLMTADIQGRLREFLKKAKMESKTQA